MNQQDSRELKLITDTVCSVVDAEKIYLFGSFAYGMPKEDSDFDIYAGKQNRRCRPLKLPVLPVIKIGSSKFSEEKHRKD